VADAPTLASQRQRLERAIELSPSYANAHSFLADVLVEQGDGPAALEKAQRAVALEPGDSYHRLALAHALNKVGRADEGRKSADLALKLAENEAERSALFSRACEGGEQDACALAKQLR